MEGLFCLRREGNKNIYYIFNEFIIKNIIYAIFSKDEI